MSSPASASGALPYLAGHLFAGRYRLVELIGRAKDGDVWRADDQVLLTAVSLKVTHPASQADRERILQSFRIVRQITHPAVRRVFDAGETEECVFYTMEFVPGNDLGAVLRRSGRLPSERVADIGRQLCGGLQAAHERGLVHCDLRPANVLIDDDGAVRIIDFEFLPGAAASPSDYIAPEQRDPGGRASTRSDLYSVGVILYELLVGELPRPHTRYWLPAIGGRGSGRRPRRPGALVADVDRALERTILQALSDDPRKRPASAAIMAASLVAVPRGRRWRAAAWLAAGGLAAAAAGLIVLAQSLLPHRAQALTEQDTIVLADFQNTTGEPVFDGALKVALAVALEQSPFLRIFPDDQSRETLRLMQRPPDERITPGVGREIAQRERLKALVAGSISALGSGYILVIEAIDATTGNVIARERIEAAAKEQVLTALGTATSRLRGRLGESLASLQRFDVPLPRATTASLEALNAYALALDQGRLLPRVEAIPHLKRALELDPEFAMAQALLSGVYANTGRRSEAPAHSRRAFELRDRVSERERFFISWRYYIDAVQAWDEALLLARAWTTTYPREAFAFNSLGLALAAFGDQAQAVEAYREAIRLDFRFVPPHGNMIGSLIALNRFSDARALLREAPQRRLTVVTERRMSYILAFVDGDAAAMAHELGLVRGTPEEMWASIWEARTEAYGGRVMRAHDLFRRGAEAARQRDLPALAAQWTAEDAQVHALARQCDAATREVGESLRLSRDNVTLEHAGRTLALCGAPGEAPRLTAELAREFPDATLTTRIQLPVTAAAVALRQGNAARALELLDAVRPYEHAPSAEFWPTYLRGHAYLELGDARSAQDQFRQILEHRGEAPASPLYPLARLGAARAAAASGDLAGARAAYEALLPVWGGADAGLEPVTRARSEYTQLQ
jgi:tetratricopeptide (TPR) repeat protein